MSDNEIPDVITELQCPRFDYLDSAAEDPVLCVAPTVWQCLMSISAREVETRFIYQIHVLDPIPAASVHHNVADDDETQEHRITPEVLKANGGQIRTELIGRLQMTRDQVMAVKISTRHKRIRPDSIKERTVFWRIEDGEWSLRDGGGNIEARWKN